MTRWIHLVLVGVLLLSATSALARKKPKPKTAKWVTMILSHGDVPADWGPALRKAGEGAATNRVWLPPPGLSLDEVQLTLGCPSFDAACAGRAAALLGADNAVVIDIAVTGATATVSVESVSDEGTVVGAADRIDVSVDDAGRDLAAAWVKGAISGTKPTILIITADLPDTEVLIDGEKVGVTPLTLIDTVAPGEHALLLRREGRAPFQRTVTVLAQTVNRETVALANGPPMKTEPKIGETPTPMPTPSTAPPGDVEGISPTALVGFSIAGVGVVGAVVGGAIAGVNYARYTSVFFTAPNGEEGTHPDGICADGASFGRAGTCDRDLTPEETDEAIKNGDLPEYRSALSGNIAGGLVVAGAGLLVAATGIVLAVGSMPGESADASVGGEIQAAPAK